MKKREECRDDATCSERKDAAMLMRYESIYADAMLFALFVTPPLLDYLREYYACAAYADDATKILRVRFIRLFISVALMIACFFCF
jgi:hypothetical protein